MSNNNNNAGSFDFIQDDISASLCQPLFDLNAAPTTYYFPAPSSMPAVLENQVVQHSVPQQQQQQHHQLMPVSTQNQTVHQQHPVYQQNNGTAAVGTLSGLGTFEPSPNSAKKRGRKPKEKKPNSSAAKASIKKTKSSTASTSRTAAAADAAKQNAKNNAMLVLHIPISKLKLEKGK